MIKDHLGDQVPGLQDHRGHLNIASTRSLGRSGKAASYSARVLGNKSTGWMFDQHDHHDYDHDDQLPWQDEEEELWWTLGNKATGWKFDDHFWSDDSDDEDDDAR